MTEKDYELRLYDRTLASFTVASSPLAPPEVARLEVEPSVRAVLPPQLVPDASPAALMSWLQTRVVPKNRAFVDKLLQQVGLAPGDTMGVIDVSRGLSLNDAYWVVPQGFSGTWKDFNLYDNDFDHILSLVAYTGYTSSQKHEAGLSSEWTTSGNYPKAWRRVDGQVCLYKSGSPIFEGASNPDLGPYSEFLAAQVAQALGIPHVTYEIDVWEGRAASVCPLMNDAETSLVPFFAATGTSGFSATASVMSALGDGAFERYLDMLVFDALVMNPDRHANNFGFLRDSRTGTYLGLAPLFDHNLALFPHDTSADFPSWDQASSRLRPAGAYMTFDEMASLVLLERHHEWCRRLLGFSFENDPLRPLDGARIRALDDFVHARARRLLDMPAHSAREVCEKLRHDLPATDVSQMPLFVQRELGGAAAV